MEVTLWGWTLFSCLLILSVNAETQTQMDSADHKPDHTSKLRNDTVNDSNVDQQLMPEKETLIETTSASYDDQSVSFQAGEGGEFTERVTTYTKDATENSTPDEKNSTSEHTIEENSTSNSTSRKNGEFTQRVTADMKDAMENHTPDAKNAMSKSTIGGTSTPNSNSRLNDTRDSSTGTTELATAVNGTMENSTLLNDVMGNSTDDEVMHDGVDEIWPHNNMSELLGEMLHGNGSLYDNVVAIRSLNHAKVARAIWMYGAPLLIAGGTLGNLLSFCVMLRKKIRHTTTSVYLMVLAVADTAVLYTGLLRMYIKYAKGYDVRLTSAFACKFHLFSVYAMLQFDSWVLVSVTLERVCAVFLPHRAKEIFTKQFATVSLIIQGLVIITINSHFFYTHELIKFSSANTTGRVCISILSTHRHYMKNIWPWIDFCLFSLIPFTIILSSNVAIVCRLLYSRYVRRQHLHPNAEVKMSSMTAILITVSVVFFVTTAPISIYLIQAEGFYKDADVYQRASLAVVWAVLNMVSYTNNAVNFLLYFLSGPRFRKEMRVMFCKKKGVVHPSHNTTTAMELQNT